MMQAIPKTLVLFVMWLILSGQYDATHLGLGLAVSLGVVWLNPADPESPFRRVRWLSALLYLPWLFVRILKSGLHVTRLILSPSLPIAPKLVRYPTDLESEGGLVLLGNSITLTPGTITVEVDSRELLVHSLDDASRRDLDEGTLERRVARVFRPGERAR